MIVSPLAAGCRRSSGYFRSSSSAPHLSISDARIHRFPQGFGALVMAIAGAE